MSLGENIYRHRTAHGWSQTDLAEALEVSRQSVSKWENNSSVPDLDKLIRMRLLFGISIDELIFGKEEAVTKQEQSPLTDRPMPPLRVMAGGTMLIFGMILFLLSIFWGDHLYFGEAFGELLSAVIVLVSLALMLPYNFCVLGICASIYFIYSVICFGFMHLNSITNCLFTAIASTVILIWFLVCGLHATKELEHPERDEPKGDSVDANNP